MFVLDTSGSEKADENSGILYVSKNDASTEDSNEIINKVNPSRQPNRNSRRLSNIKRYHEANKFSVFKPGKISRELRHALDLKKHEIPIHIYKMRSLGYPPGWLRKARVEELPSFDDDNTSKKCPSVKYRLEELIEYPGFNIYKEDLVDESHLLKCPNIQDHHLIDNFIASLHRESYFSSQESLLKRNGSQPQNKLDHLEAERQRILEEINSLAGCSTDLKIASTNQAHSPSHPLPEAVGLASDNTLDNNQTSPRSPQLSLCSESKQEVCLLEVGETQNNLNDVPPVLTDAEHAFDVETSQHLLSRKMVPEAEKGTAIPIGLQSLLRPDASASETPEHKPNIEAFKAGIQPYAPFENLPDSQGTYLRVRETLKRARSSLDTEKASPTPSVSLKNSVAPVEITENTKKPYRVKSMNNFPSSGHRDHYSHRDSNQLRSRQMQSNCNQYYQQETRDAPDYHNHPSRNVCPMPDVRDREQRIYQSTSRDSSDYHNHPRDFYPMADVREEEHKYDYYDPHSRDAPGRRFHASRSYFR